MDDVNFAPKLDDEVAATPDDELPFEPDRPRIWVPPLSLIASVLAIPLLSIWLAGIVEPQVAIASPMALPVIDAWRTGSVVAIALGLVLVLAVPVVVVGVRSRPRLLLWTLQKGVRIGVLLVAIFVLIHGLLSVGVLLSFEQILFGRVFPATGTLILLGGLAASVYLAAATLGKLNEPMPTTPAVPLPHGVGLGLEAFVARLAERMAAPVPDRILIGAPFEFQTAEGSFMTLDGSVSGRLLSVSLPELALVSEDHLEAILAHELAHFRSGDTLWSARLAPELRRLFHAIETLRTESEGIARVGAFPGLRWLEYVAGSFLGAVAENRRRSEAGADAAAAEIVGGERVAEALAILAAMGPLEDPWAEHVQAAIAGRIAEPMPDLRSLGAALLAKLTIDDVIEASFENADLEHPLLLERLGALGVVKPAILLPERSALDSLLGAEAVDLSRQLIDGLRPTDARLVVEALNPPRLTPGTFGWLILGLVGFAFFSAVLLGGGPVGDLPIIAALALVLWLLYPLVYPHLQREVVLDSLGIRIRSWWRRWIERDAVDARWTRIWWIDRPELTIGIEAIATFAMGDRRVRLWLDPWPRRELWKLIDGLRGRDVPVHFGSMMSTLDDERRAVVYRLGERLLVPGVRRTPEDRLIETAPVKVLGPDVLKLASVLTDRLADPVESLGTKTRPVEIEELARLAGTDGETFSFEAERVTIGGYKSGWSVRLGDLLPWDGTGKVDGEAAAWAVFQLLSLPIEQPVTEAQSEDDPVSDPYDEDDEDVEDVEDEFEESETSLRPGPAPDP